MKHVEATKVSAGARAALGIDRLVSLTQRSSPHQWVDTAMQRWEPATRRNFAKMALMTIAVLLGFWGFQATHEPAQEAWRANVIWHNLFRTLQLLTAQFPNQLPTELPLQLQIARFAMPIFAIWFTIAALLRKFDRPLLVWIAGQSRNHVVLIGMSEASLALARAYRELKRPVVAIIPVTAGDTVSPMELAGARVILGDACQSRTLRKATIHRAAALISIDDLGIEAVKLASVIASLNSHRHAEEPSLVCVMRLGHRELRTLMATQIASAMRHHRVDLRIYVKEYAVARALIAKYPVDWGQAPGPHDIHAVIVGFNDMGAELFLHLARIAVPAPGRRTILTVIDRNADGLREQLLVEHPGLSDCAELRFIQADIHPSSVKAGDIEEWLLSPVPASAIYVCWGDDHENLTMSLGLRRAYAQAGVSSAALFVYQGAGTTLVDALPQIHVHGFDTLRVIPFGGVDQETDPIYLIDEEIDDLARLVHEDYLESRKRMAATVTSSLTTAPAVLPWPQLADVYRVANRSQADHIQLKLRSLGMHATVEAGGPELSIDGGQLEALATQEHDRWCRDRWMSGWTYAEKRDDALRYHPNLVPYERLSESVRDLDRQTIRGLQALLARLGINLKRDLRVGIWFDRPLLISSEKLVAAVVSKVGAIVGQQPDSYLQLVLPLRASAEFSIVTTLSRSNNIGLDVVLILEPLVKTEVGLETDQQLASKLIAVADRTFTLRLEPNDSGGPLGCLCDVCDLVIVVSEDAPSADPLLGQLSERQRRRTELLALSK